MGWLEDKLYRPSGEGNLGRRTPKDWAHVDKYPLRALSIADQPKAVPVVLGINWYADLDNPEKFDGRWWVARTGIRGKVRGGHCVCLKSAVYNDPWWWWDWYNQGHEGACVGFGTSRMMSLLNRKRYFARWLWDQAKVRDDWSDTNPGDENGTSVRAACDVLRSLGHVPWKRSYNNLNQEGGGSFIASRDALAGNASDGITAYRWATKVDEITQALNTPLHDQLQAVPLLNSWGRAYPHATWLPYEVLQRLLDEEGEAAVVTDK